VVNLRDKKSDAQGKTNAGEKKGLKANWGEQGGHQKKYAGVGMRKKLLPVSLIDTRGKREKKSIHEGEQVHPKCVATNKKPKPIGENQRNECPNGSLGGPRVEPAGNEWCEKTGTRTEETLRINPNPK